MKALSILIIAALTLSSVFGQPSPKKGHAREKTESKKEAKVARVKMKENNKKYRHEAKDKKKFNNM